MELLKEITDWLKEQSHYKAERVECGTDILEKEVVTELETAVDNFIKETKLKSLIFSPSLLYKVCLA